MRTVARIITAAFTTVLALGQLRAAVPFRPEGGSDATSATLSASGNSTVLEHELSRQLDRYVFYPVMGRDQGLFGDVVVSFVINTEGRIEVIAASASNADLGNYVLARLAKVDVGENPDGVWRTTHVRFRFRPQA